MKRRAFDSFRLPVVGDRVQVRAGKEHDEATKGALGTIKVVEGTALGVLFDGMSMIHKWYVAEELDLVENDAETSPGRMRMDGRDGRDGPKRRCQGRDRVQLDAVSQRRETPEGYLIVPGALSRTGVQEYTADELGLTGPDWPKDKIVKLYRPPEEVFHFDAVTSFDGQPITIGHPPGPVTADSWKRYSVGHVRDVAPSGSLMRGTLIVNDAAGIKAIKGGKEELSMGYEFDLDLTPGTAADGSPYHGIQRRLRGNHAAAVDYARGGRGLRVADSTNNQERPMATRNIVVDGINLELETIQASLVEKVVADQAKATKTAIEAKDAAEKRAVAADAALAAATKAATDSATAHDAKVKELEAKILKPEAIQAMVTELTKVTADAKLLAPDVKPEGKTAPAIRAEVLSDVIAKDAALKGVADAVLAGAEPAKADEAVARSAFNAVMAARAARGNDSTTADEANAAIGKALAGDSDGKPGELTGRALMMFRENHKGMTPAEFAKSAS